MNQQSAVGSILPDHRPGSDGGGGAEVVRSVRHGVVEGVLEGVQRQGPNLIFGTSVESGRHSKVTLFRRRQCEESTANSTGVPSLTGVRRTQVGHEVRLREEDEEEVERAHEGGGERMSRATSPHQFDTRGIAPPLTARAAA